MCFVVQCSREKNGSFWKQLLIRRATKGEEKRSNGKLQSHQNIEIGSKAQNISNLKECLDRVVVGRYVMPRSGVDGNDKNWVISFLTVMCYPLKIKSIISYCIVL